MTAIWSTGIVREISLTCIIFSLYSYPLFNCSVVLSLKSSDDFIRTYEPFYHFVGHPLINHIGLILDFIKTQDVWILPQTRFDSQF